MPSSSSTNSFQFSSQLLTKLRSASSVAVLTGAGISAESGVPTFRGEQGLWRNFRPEQLATTEAFLSDPALVWEWYSWRRGLIGDCQPNPGHRALVRMQELVEGRGYGDPVVTSGSEGLTRKGVGGGPVKSGEGQGSGRFTLVTQNVDDLHDRAGSKGLLRLHGEIFRSFCMDCGADHPSVRLLEPGQVPRCGCSSHNVVSKTGGSGPDLGPGRNGLSKGAGPSVGAENAPEHHFGASGAPIRPGVVWFGEGLPMETLELAAEAARSCDVFFSIGTSAVVYPAAGLVEVAARAGAYVVEVNVEPSALADVANEVLLGPAGKVLPALVEAAWGG